MKVLAISDPSAYHFDIKPNKDGKVRFITKISKKADNRLQVIDGADSNEWGLYVPPAQVSTDITRFPLTWSGNARGQDGSESRRLLQVSAVGMGIIHLDMMVIRTGTIASLPNNAPTPTSLIEMQLGDGSIYIDRNSRSIVATGNVPLNRRFIVDMVGFFG